MAKEALIQVTVTKKNNANYSKTLLLSTARVNRWEQNSDGYTVFLYTERRDRRVSPDKYLTEIGTPTFEALMREATNEDPIEVFAQQEYRLGKWVTLDNEKRLYFPIKDLALAWDKDTSSAYLILEDAHFNIKKYIVSHTIEEIDQTASISLSLSAS